MKAMRILGTVAATILATSIGALTACGAPEKEEVPTSQAVSAASVSIAILDEAGNQVGTGSGTLIAPRLVLTAGHLLAGYSKWRVTGADGKTVVTGSRALTYDWLAYDDDNAHPRKNDVGVIQLDESIKLDAYPRVAGNKLTDGAKATRMRGVGGGFSAIDTVLGRVGSAPNSYLADFPNAETLDTGGAVYNEQGIVGVVSGRGLTTGKLYVARTDRLATWMKPKVVCGGGSLGARTYSAATPKEEICDDAGNPIPGSSSSSGGPGSPNDSCSNDNNGACYGNCNSNGGGGGIHDNYGSSGSNPNNNPNDGESGGPNGSSGGAGGAGGTGAGSSGSTPNQGGGGSNPSTSGGPSGSGDGSGGAGGSTGGGGPNGSTNPGGSGPGGGPGSIPGGSGGAGGGTGYGSGRDHDSGEACQGSNDNPDTCPPEDNACFGRGCGGGRPDQSIDYGFSRAGRGGPAVVK